MKLKIIQNSARLLAKCKSSKCCFFFVVCWLALSAFDSQLFVSN